VKYYLVKADKTNRRWIVQSESMHHALCSVAAQALVMGEMLSIEELK